MDSPQAVGRDFATPHHPKAAQIHFNPTFADSPDDEMAPENFLMANLTMRPRTMSHHLSSTKVPSRRWLKMQARFWRSLMSFGMTFHDLASPKPPKAAFVRKIATDTIPIELFFYVPPDYQSTLKNNPDHRYPVVVNFHGGGFSLGHATDDRYWARVIVKDTKAIFISVNYRRAPEHPFPLPVDDCVEALLYLCSHADELQIDVAQIALSGFSAGANLAFTVPFRLTYYTGQPNARDNPPFEDTYIKDENEDGLGPSPSISRIPTNNNHLTPYSESNSLQGNDSPSSSTHLTADPQYARQPLLRSAPSYISADSRCPPNLRIVSILAWYPLLDWTLSRAAKKRSSRKPEKTLPKVFTDLFDYAYLPPPDHAGHHCSPYASPGLAPDHMIQNGLPHRMQLWLCEWDMLLGEGERFANRLTKLGKDCKTEMIQGVPHGWDKSPNPFRDQSRIDKLYGQAAGYLDSVFREAERRETVGQGIGLGGKR